MRKQMVEISGDPNYGQQGVSVHSLSGAAFDSNQKTDLFYNDAAFVPPDEKETLIKKAEVNEQKGLYDGFIHPCSSDAGGRCPGTAVSAAYPDNLDLQLAAARIQFAPYLGIRLRGRLVKTDLEWVYLQGEKGIRERFNKQKAYEKAPVAKVDF